jgi:putative transport protein
MIDWFVETLRAYPPLAVFLALGIGFLIGPLKFAGFNLGNVTATLLAGVAIGQLGIELSGDLKTTLFLLFLFAVGYGVGPQFVRGLATDGPKQIAFSLSVLVLCLAVPYAAAVLTGMPLGYAAGMFAGSQTISAAIGVSSDQINNLGLPVEEAKTYVSQVPIAYAVTYIFGTIGSAIILAQIGPRLIGVNLPAACKEYEEQMGGGGASSEPGISSAYRGVALRGYRVDEGSSAIGQPVSQLLPEVRIFVERVRRGDKITDADGSTVLQAGDVVAVSGPHKLLVEHLSGKATEVDDPELLNAEAEIVDVFVSNKVSLERRCASSVPRTGPGASTSRR